MPTNICGDGYATNMKASRLLETGFDLKSLFSRGASHAWTSTVRRLCTSINSSQTDAKSIYENLRYVLKHFAKCPMS